MTQGRVGEGGSSRRDEGIGSSGGAEQRVLLSWSSGKDCAWALGVLRADPRVEVVGLLTTLNATHDRVAMHATRRTLLEAQAAAVHLPLLTVDLPWPCPNELYEQRMSKAIDAARALDVTHVAFGDLFLEDIRDYRVRQMAGTGIATLFPLWGEPTDALAERMVDAGIEAIVTCVDPSRLPRNFLGRRFDRTFLEELPAGVDPCGENGEFHTCVLFAPGFTTRIGAELGEVVERDGFCFVDLLPARLPLAVRPSQ